MKNQSVNDASVPATNTAATMIQDMRASPFFSNVN
jgi:hypothetical protein